MLATRNVASSSSARHASGSRYVNPTIPPGGDHLQNPALDEGARISRCRYSRPVWLRICFPRLQVHVHTQCSRIPLGYYTLPVSQTVAPATLVFLFHVGAFCSNCGIAELSYVPCAIPCIVRSTITVPVCSPPRRRRISNACAKLKFNHREGCA